MQVLLGNREKLLNEKFAARGAGKQYVAHAGESVLRFRICQNLLVNCCAKTFRMKFHKEPLHRHNINRYQLVQALKPTDKPLRKKFCEKFQEKFDVNGFENTLVFTDEVFCGKVNRHNLRFWGTENVYVTLEHQRDSPKMNVFCALSNSCVFGPFFFAEKSINGDLYQDMLSEWLLPQLEESIPDFILQQDGAPPHWNKNVHEFLNVRLPHHWIGRAGPRYLTCLHWPPRSPDLTPCDFFLWGFVKDKVFVRQLPQDLEELKQRITAVLNSITGDMLSRVSQELDYRVDICRVTGEAHIEHL
ncbi:DUF4817 domain-containing protein [Trichonephila clavipes]|uniref:DUF4817 domain-containing protein n=1 Tax=Trichonephila clavipes TaxID=2585209 RepID=A0A8X6R1M7_TRICX|nr:DUF4817 domain-containing protein [Trichonephila clavipes]